MSEWTIVAVYPDEGQTVTETVSAPDVPSAIADFWKGRGPDDTGLSIVEVFMGSPVSCGPVCWVDHPNAEG